VVWGVDLEGCLHLPVLTNFRASFSVATEAGSAPFRTLTPHPRACTDDAGRDGASALVANRGKSVRELKFDCRDECRATRRVRSSSAGQFADRA
jgi:hypothetical protein